MHVAGNLGDLPGQVKRIVAWIGISLQIPAVALQERQRRILGPGFGERVDDQRWAVAVVLGVDPEFCFIGLAPCRIVVLLRQGRVVRIDVPGIGFDLPTVEPVFKEHADTNGTADRLTFHSGDFFKDALPEADVFLMGNILHDRDLTAKGMLIDKAFAALPEGGALIVFEALIDDERRTNAFGLMMSLNMLLETPGGFDFTGGDCIEWMTKAGFRSMRVQHLAGPDSMVIGIK